MPCRSLTLRTSKTSDFLGRTKIKVEEAVVTKPNAKHIKTSLQMLGLENAKPSPVPGRKLELQKDKPLSQGEKETYASCGGSAIYLSQDRPDIKFSVKELAKHNRKPRECDMQNLKVLGRYLKGTQEWPCHRVVGWCHDEVSAITSVL